MHKKSIEAAKALKEEGGSCDGDSETISSEAGKPCRQPSPPFHTSASVETSLDRGLPPSSDGRSVETAPNSGGTVCGGEAALRSESIATLRAKVR